MSSSIYARLGFDSTNPIANSTIQPLSDDVLAQMKLMPAWLNAWQTKDVAESNTSGYFQNPLIGTIASANSVANTMMSMVANNVSITGSTSSITTLLANTMTNAKSIGYSNTELSITSECDTFLYVTNRQSNVVPMDSNITIPHYQTAIGFGKMMMYLTNQSDGIQNNSPLLGSFTSLYSQNTLDALIANTTPLLVILQNSISHSVIISPPSESYSSNISLSDAQSLDTNMAAIYNTMYRCRTSDTSFFQNCSLVLADYSKASQFNSTGQTENQLIQERIGSPKLLSRLNANT
jgi:hypothetical protein